MAETRLSLAPLYTVFFSPMLLIVYLPLSPFALFLKLVLFLSVLLCLAHFRGFRGEASRETQAKGQGQKHIGA